MNRRIEASGTNLNDYFNTIELDDYIVLIAICDEGSSKLHCIVNLKLKFLKEAKIGFRDAAVVLLDSNDAQVFTGEKQIEKTFLIGNCQSKDAYVFSAGYGSPKFPKGRAFFTIGSKKFELFGNRGLNFCVISKDTLEVVDLFSVDTYADSNLSICRYYETQLNDLIESGKSIPKAFYKKALVIAQKKLLQCDEKSSLHILSSLTPTTGREYGDIADILAQCKDESAIKKSFEYSKMAYDLGESASFRQLAFMYFYGIGTIQDNEQGRYFYRKYAKNINFFSKDHAVEVLNPVLYDMKTVVIYGTLKEYYKIFSACLQNCLPVEYYCPVEDVSENCVFHTIIDENTISHLPLDSAVLIYKGDKDLIEMLGTSTYSMVHNDFCMDMLELNPIFDLKQEYVVADTADSRFWEIVKALHKAGRIGGILCNKKVPEGSWVYIPDDGKYKCGSMEFYDWRSLLFENCMFLPYKSTMFSPYQITDLLQQYHLGNELYSKICCSKTMSYIHQHSSVGDASKAVSLIPAMKRKYNIHEIQYITYGERAYLKDLQPDMDKIYTLQKYQYYSVLTYLEINLMFRTKHIIFIKDGDNILPHLFLYSYQDDFIAFKSSWGLPINESFQLKSDICSISNTGKILIVPDANWTFSSSRPYANTFPEYVRKCLIKLISELTERGYDVYVNTTKTNSDLSGLSFDISLLQAAHMAPVFDAIIGPMTGFIEYMLLSGCPRAYVLMPDDKTSKYYDPRRIKHTSQKVTLYNAERMSPDEVADMIASDMGKIDLNYGTTDIKTELDDVCMKISQIPYDNSWCTSSYIEMITGAIGKTPYYPKVLERILNDNTNAETDFFIATLYRNGIFVQQDLAAAVEWMRKASDQNLGWAKWELFDILYRINTPESLDEAVSIAVPLAKSGNRELQARLGRAYRDGKGVGQDLAAAVEWMRKASDQNLGWAKWELNEINREFGTSLLNPDFNRKS